MVGDEPPPGRDHPTCAGAAGPPEHGQQAARSKRDRPGRAREQDDGLSHVGAAAGGALESI
ncbi:MAG: hypothetical protein ACRDTX_15670 [Pseudonocardiaceae bacterium]